MSKSGTIWVVLAMAALVVGCSPGAEEGPKDPVDPPASGAAESATELSPASVLIAHSVSDFETWKAAFDADAPARREATCRGHYLKRGLDDPNTIYVYCQADDAARLRAFLESNELAQTMEQAGVVGDPEIYLMRPDTRDLVAGEELPGIIVIHEVEDYDRWRQAYDDFDAFRRSSGIVGHAVSRGLDNPNRLVVYHQARDEAALRSFVASEELRVTMQQAGVVGDPDIRFIRVAGFGSY